MDYFISHCKDPHSPTKISIPFKQCDIYHINRSRISSIHQWTILILVKGGKDSNFPPRRQEPIPAYDLPHGVMTILPALMRSNQPRKSQAERPNEESLPGRIGNPGILNPWIIPKTSHSNCLVGKMDFLEVRQLSPLNQRRTVDGSKILLTN